MDLDVRESGSLCILKLKGRFVSGQPVNDLKSAFMNALSTGHIFLIFDLEEMPFVDSSGIGALVDALRTSTKAGGSVKLVKPAPFIARTLKMVGLLDLFEVFDEVDQAVAACPA